MAEVRNVSFGIDFSQVNPAAIKDANKAVDKLRDEMKGVGAEAPKTGKSMAAAFKSAGEQAGKVGKSLTKSLTLPLVGLGTAAVGVTANFDDSMANVQKISGATGKEFDDLRAKAMELGSTTAYSASEAAEGMGVLAASGMEANDVIAVSEDMFNLMSAGSVSAETAASVLTNTMAQFNMTAEESGKIVDTFAATSAKSKISVDQLEHGMSIAGSTMAGMNMDIVDSTAAFGHLANAGMPVEQLGTAINAMGREIKANAGDFKALGVEVYDSEGKLRDMGSVMKDLEGATAGMNDEQRDAALSTVFSGQAMQGATNWLNQGADAYSKLTDEIIRETNAAETMAAIQEDTVGGAFRAVKSAMEGMMIEIGDVIKEPIQEVAKLVARAAGAFGKLSDPMKKAVVGAAGIAVAIGPMLLGFSKLVSIGSKVGGVLSGVSLPVVAAVAAAALLGAALYRLWNTNEEFRDTVIQVWETIKTKLGEALKSITQFWETHGEEIKTKVTAIFDRIGEIISGAFEIIVGVVSVALEWIGEFWSNHGETIMNAASLAWDTISGVIDGAMQVIQGIIEVVLGIIEGDWDAVWSGVQSIFEGVMTAVEAAWSAASEVVGAVIEGTVEAVTGAFHTAVDKVKEAWQGVKDFLSNPIKGTVSLVQKGVQGVRNFFGGSHKTGLNRVPGDGYQATLHKDEMVLTRSAASQFRALGGTKDGLGTNPSVAKNTPYLRRKPESKQHYVDERSIRRNDDGQAEGRKEQNISFNPVYNIEISGSADESSKRELEKTIDKQTRRLFNEFFREMKLRGI